MQHEQRSWVSMSLYKEEGYLKISPLNLHGDIKFVDYMQVLQSIPEVGKIEKEDHRTMGIPYFKVFPRETSIEELRKRVSLAFGQAMTPESWSLEDWSVFLDCLEGQLWWRAQYGSPSWDEDEDRIEVLPEGDLPELYEWADLDQEMNIMSTIKVKFYRDHNVVREFSPNQEELEKMRFVFRAVVVQLENAAVYEGERRDAEFNWDDI